MTALKLDADLLAPRKVLRTVPHEEGGWLIDLACGHQVWIPLAPSQIECGMCLQKLVDQIRAVQSRQRLD